MKDEGLNRDKEQKKIGLSEGRGAGGWERQDEKEAREEGVKEDREDKVEGGRQDIYIGARLHVKFLFDIPKTGKIK